MSRKRFRKEKKLYSIDFAEDHELYGFECLMAGVSLERFIDITRLSAALETPEGRTPENIEKQFTVIGDLLVEWNLDDDDDVPVPCNYDGLKVQDFGFVMDLMSGYMAAIASVPKASNNDSSSGETSEAESLGLGMSFGSQPS